MHVMRKYGVCVCVMWFCCMSIVCVCVCVRACGVRVCVCV